MVFPCKYPHVIYNFLSQLMICHTNLINIIYSSMQHLLVAKLTTNVKPHFVQAYGINNDCRNTFLKLKATQQHVKYTFF